MSLQVFPQFKVIDECDHWLVVDKAAPLIVHPTNRKDEPTLLGGIERLLSFEVENGARPAVVNRLDRDTSGLVLVAKRETRTCSIVRLWAALLARQRPSLPASAQSPLVPRQMARSSPPPPQTAWWGSSRALA